MFLAIFSFFILAVYMLLILLFMVGWMRIPKFEADTLKNSLKISVVIACKNEENNLPILLNILMNQRFKGFELILVNDHSTDNTLLIMEKFSEFFLNITILNSVENGKKAALKHGILHAKGELIITTDADCSPTTTWIDTIINFQHINCSDLIVCPVKIKTSSSLFSKLQSHEFTSLVASGAGAIGVGMPILCNGANLAFTKSAWLASQADLMYNEISGDDVFLLLSIKKRGGRIAFLKSKDAIVTTEASTNLASFMKQRSRWASKSPSFSDWQITSTALIVFIISLLEVLLIVFSFAEFQYLKLLTIMFFLKFLIDSVFMLQTKDFYNLRFVLFYSIILSIIYPFYIVIVALKSIIFKPRSWK